MMAHADKPDHKLEVEFLQALDEAKFLFRPAVHQDLVDLWRRSCQFFAIKSVMSHRFQTTGDYGAENIERGHAFLLWLTSRLETLADLFGDEARLGIEPLPTP